eukprot:391371-Prymnesium_polylepis.1
MITDIGLVRVHTSDFNDIRCKRGFSTKGVPLPGRPRKRLARGGHVVNAVLWLRWLGAVLGADARGAPVRLRVSLPPTA